MSISPSSQPPWHLEPEILRRVITHLPFPSDRAVCRARMALGRAPARPPAPMADCSFCTIAGDDDDDSAAFFHRIPGLADNVTCCLGAAADGWLVLDCTDDLFRRTYSPFGQVVARHGGRHNHTYLLHNPFLRRDHATARAGNVPGTLEIRKVLMRSSATTDDVVANNVVLCRPGTYGCCFMGGGRLYGITKDEDLLEFHLAEDEDDGSPVVPSVISDLSSTPCPMMMRRTMELVADGEDIAVDDEVPYDYIVTTRRLVKSRSGDELLMVPPFTRVYTRKVEVFKADVGAGQWVPVVTGDALFHSRSFSKATHVYGTANLPVSPARVSAAARGVPSHLPWQGRLSRRL
ncbi:hypothetical protein HU200_028351 [Digitaria exilis]|uniref:KIB1-4 beta-propeller domain-containing protein n=1 Tax=Digitaria exilis TaxID=1010633 RepID=A0A835BV28_9POAL|nr:hypothetical protein HU200_028351 [Digitaria exilis]